MQQKKSIGFGFRGWMLIITLFCSFMAFQVFTNYPLNILSDFYGGSQTVAMIFTIATLCGIITQIILSRFIPKFKSIKKVTMVFGIVAIICAIVVAAIPVGLQQIETADGIEMAMGVSNQIVWYIAYFLVNYSVTIYALFLLSIIAGQWFPRRKGTVMGIATIAYPVANGVIGFFAESVFAPLQSGGTAPAILSSFLPFLIVMVVGFIIFVVFISDYPEQVGAYRDNDKSITPEVANKMMLEEIENKKTTVWTTGHTFKSRDFWFASITCGLILMGAIGVMTQSSTIIAHFPDLNYTTIMMIIAVCGAFGSWLLGVLDTKFGTKKSMLIATFMMVASGICGVIAMMTDISAFLIAALILIAMFMGASSNYTVSVAAQYWRREDFSSVFACLNPIANIFNALSATVVAALINSTSGITGVFVFILIIGVIGVILMFLFSGKHVKETDDKYRQAAGKPLDDALVGIK